MVSAWFDFLTDPQRELAQALAQAIRRVAPQAVEAVRWGQLVFSVDDQALMALVPFKNSVNLQFFNGSALTAHQQVLEGNSRGSRHLRCRLHQPVDEALVAELVRACIRTGRQFPEVPAEGAG